MGTGSLRDGIDGYSTAGGVSEILFVDPGVDDIATILTGLRPEVDAIVLDRTRPPARQIADALAERQNLDAIHIIAHGGPGRVSFSAGEWSTATLNDAADDLASIGKALGSGGELRLWSCRCGAGHEGDAFVKRLAQATGAVVAASSGLVGAEARGGAWDLDLTAAGPPPLNSPAMYGGILDSVRRIVSGEVPYDPADHVNYVVVNSRDKRVVATFFLPGHANVQKFAIPVMVPSANETYQAGKIDEHGNFVAAAFAISETSPFTGPAISRRGYGA